MLIDKTLRTTAKWGCHNHPSYLLLGLIHLISFIESVKIYIYIYICTLYKNSCFFFHVSYSSVFVEVLLLACLRIAKQDKSSFIFYFYFPFCSLLSLFLIFPFFLLSLFFYSSLLSLLWFFFITFLFFFNWILKNPFFLFPLLLYYFLCIISYFYIFLLF